jgi:hypothetical protein
MTRKQQMIDSAKSAELNSRTIDLSKKQVFMSAYVQGWKDADSHPQWISAEDELPPENGKTQQSISVWATDGLTSGEFRYNFETQTWTDMWGDPFDITHWMSLPPLPRKEDKK